MSFKVYKSSSVKCLAASQRMRRVTRTRHESEGARPLLSSSADCLSLSTERELTERKTSTCSQVASTSSYEHSITIAIHNPPLERLSSPCGSGRISNEEEEAWSDLSDDAIASRRGVLHADEMPSKTENPEDKL